MEKRSQVEILGRRIFWVPNRSPTHDLPDTGWTLWPLSYGTRGEQGHSTRFLNNEEVLLTPARDSENFFLSIST